MMTVGEVVAALARCCSDYDGDTLLFSQSIYSIEVKDDNIEVYFVDANTPNVRIYLDGKREYL